MQTATEKDDPVGKIRNRFRLDKSLFELTSASWVLVSTEPFVASTNIITSRTRTAMEVMFAL
jgi:hypothetical protein